jgi:outer membrane protein assembly factor BamB
MMKLSRTVLALGASMFFSHLVAAEDWPQWNGPTRNGDYQETGIISEIPKSGLKQLWRAPVSGAYSGPAVADGRVFVTDYVRESGDVTNNPGGRDSLTGKERVLCLDAKSGKQIWEHSYDRPYKLSYPAGPRVTPQVDQGRVYALGAEGDLLCLNAQNGKIIWQRQLAEEYKTEAPIWGYAAAPLIIGDQLITLAGGEGSVVVSLDKATGKEKWRALTASEIGYAPPTIIEHAGVTQLLVWDADNLNSLNPANGQVYWSEPLKPQYGMSIMAPVKSGDKLFASGIGEVAGMYQLQMPDPGVKKLWEGGDRKSAVYCGNSTPVFSGDYIFGSDCGGGALICVRASDGKRMWETYQPTSGGDRRASHGTAFLSRVGDRYFIFSETGDFIIAKLDEQKYDEVSRFHVIDPTNDCFGRKVVWTYPAYANRCLFVRNDEEIVCYSLAK